MPVAPGVDDRLHSSARSVARLCGELHDAHDGDVGLRHEGPARRFDLHIAAHDPEFDLTGRTGSLDVQADLRIRAAAHEVGHLVDGDAAHIHAVDSHDQVAGRRPARSAGEPSTTEMMRGSAAALIDHHADASHPSLQRLALRLRLARAVR